MNHKKLFFSALGLVLAVFLWQPLQVLHAAFTPIVDGVTAAATVQGTETAFNLIDGSTSPLYVYGQVTDGDGCLDVTSMSGVFYRSDVSGADACTPDNNNCYTIGSGLCSITDCTGEGDFTALYQCTLPVQYYADATASGPNVNTDWTAKITATDAAALTASNSDTIEMNGLMALNGGDISYGSMLPDAVSEQQTNSIQNTGNTGLDLSISAADPMTCSGEGSAGIPQANTHYTMDAYVGTFDEAAWAAETPLSSTPTNVEFNLAPQTDDAVPVLKNLYFALKLALGTRGTCTGTITLDGTADTEGGW